MKANDLAVSIGIAIFARAHRIAQDNNQVIGENRDLYVTLAQLENEFLKLRNELHHKPSAIKFPETHAGQSIEEGH